MKKEWHQGKKWKNKDDVEEIKRVLCAFAIAPWWWFGHTRDLRVVVVVSCYHVSILKIRIFLRRESTVKILKIRKKI